MASALESFVGHQVHREVRFFQVSMCAKTHFDTSVEPTRLFFSKYLYYRALGDTHSFQGQKTRSQTSKGLAVSALRARPSSFQKTLFHHVEFLTTRVNGAKGF